ncbi:MAG: type I-D CRISPR-associated protein Cas7/Csc2 [Acidobacteriia bacterium]|nr:type I-D CRISPR-associated protein Cas7/Csc2 [Terriglobia bacterium]
MMKYQVVILRQLKGFGQFVTESRDEANTYEFGDGDERPIIFGEKLKAVERRTIMRKVREVLEVNCWLTTHKKGGDGGISGLCMSCPACVLFGGTYAPKKGGGTGPKNVVQMRRAYYTGAFPFQGGGIRDVTFNAVDERTGQTGQALGTNQIIEPRDFIDVVTVEAENEQWAKLLVWGIEHSDRYGANTRIYGEIHNEVLGVVVDPRLRIAAIDLARLAPGADVKKNLEEKKLVLTTMPCADSEIAKLIEDLTKDEAVEDLARRKNSVDVSVEEYLQKTAVHLELTLPVEKKDGKEVAAWKKWKPGQRLAFLTDGKKSQYALARDIEKANFAEPEDVEEEATQ